MLPLLEEDDEEETGMKPETPEDVEPVPKLSFVSKLILFLYRITFHLSDTSLTKKEKHKVCC